MYVRRENPFINLSSGPENPEKVLNFFPSVLKIAR